MNTTTQKTDRFFGAVFWLGIAGLVLFAASAVVTSSEDFGFGVQGEAENLVVQILGYGGVIFMLAGLILIVEVALFVKSSWNQLTPFGRFVGTIGVFIGSLLSGYLYHFFFVIRGKRSVLSIGGQE
jgi:hypothetical protein